MLLPEIKNADWLTTCNPEIVLHDDSYKKHLKQHCNKVLLRVRMLYYLKAEVLGEAADKAFEGTPAKDLDVLLPDIDYVEIPVDWWNADADKSLLIGVFKHGYERYNAMRADPALCFLEKVGMPDEKLLCAEQNVTDGVQDAPERGNTDKEESSADRLAVVEKQEEISDTCGPVPEKKDDSVAAQDGSDPDKSSWPVSSALTARLRRLVTIYQRCNRKELPSRPDVIGTCKHGYWLQEEMIRRANEMDPVNNEIQKRWTRREQADFYRTVSSFGVIYEPEKKVFDWTQFRSISRLEKKTDESLEKYFYNFVAMCKNVCRLPHWKDDGPTDPNIYVEPITEERAARTLYRIELLRKIREQVLRCPQLHERLKLCRPSLYLPVWWECGKHDRDLLIGTAKHGLNRTDYYIMNDPQLSFLDAYRNYAQNKRTGVLGEEHVCCHHQANSKLYYSSLYSQAERKQAPAEAETDNCAKLMNSGNDLLQAENTSQDGSCENFMSKVRSMISANYDESSLPDSLSCMLYDEKACNSEHSSFARDSPSCTDISSNATKVAEGKTDGDEDLSSCDAETIRESTYLDHLQFGSDLLEGQNIGQELSEKEANPSESFAQETCNALQHMENQYISPKSVPFERDGVESVLSIGVYGPSLRNFDIKVQPEKRLMGLLHEKSLEEKLMQSQSHSEEEEEEEEEDHLETVTDIGKDRGEAKCSTQVEQKHNSCILTTLDALMEERNKVLVESVSSELAASKCDSEPGMGEDDQAECESLEEHTPGLQEIQTCHHHYHHSARSQASAIQVELLKSHPVCMEGDLWGDDSEEKRDSPVTQSLYENEIKREEEECEHQDLDKRDGIGQIQDGFEKFSEDESKSSAFAVPGEGDELHDVRAPTIAQLLQEKTLYSFSEWPKDRVIINRIDNICHAILKGKWPSSSQSFDIPYIMPNPALVSSTCNRSGYTEPDVSESSFSNGVLATQLPKETFLAPTFVKDESKHRQSYEFEMERDAKHQSLDQLVASHSHPSAVLNGWRDAVDLSRVPDGTSASSTPFSMSTNIPKLGTMNALQGSLGMDLSGILQAGLIHPVTGQIVNGSLRRDDAAIRRRRGRRKNVEGIDLILLKERSLQTGLPEDEGQTVTSNSNSDGPVITTSSQQTVPATNVQTDKIVPNKSLLDWLRQQSDYTLEIPGFGTNFIEKPKQRRQRCKDPSKLDINSLTGEERVPVVHKGTGRRLGGAMAPALKELPRWLDANMEYAVAADWSDIVKLSGFLPESKFNRILTEPVLRDVGPRRRGRRPRSELFKSPGIGADASSGMGPLFMNGLIAGMDLVGLQSMRNMQGIPLAGLVGFPAGFAAVPAGEDVKSTLSMLPMMLPGMAAVPQMFGVGGLLNPSIASTCTSTAPTSLASTTKSGTTHSENETEDKQNTQGSKIETVSEDKLSPNSFSDQSEPAITTSSPVAFNPFLIPGMSSGLIYPSMFLSPGIGMALPGLQQTRHSEATNLESQKRKKKKTKGELANVEPETLSLSDKEHANKQNCTEQIPYVSMEHERDVPAEAEEEEELKEIKDIN